MKNMPLTLICFLLFTSSYSLDIVEKRIDSLLAINFLATSSSNRDSLNMGEISILNNDSVSLIYKDVSYPMVSLYGTSAKDSIFWKLIERVKKDDAVVTVFISEKMPWGKVKPLLEKLAVLKRLTVGVIFEDTLSQSQIKERITKMSLEK